jgi:thioredoxin-dependent peroxiredoxin
MRHWRAFGRRRALVADVQAGQNAPPFRVETDQGRLALSDLVQRAKLVLAFYYEDMTPTCSTQVASLKDSFATFQEMGATVLAISSDSLDSHQRFCDRLGGLPFPLGSDPDLDIARAYGVVDEGGKRARRAVFVIGKDSTVLLALPYYNPANLTQFEQVFRALEG